MIAITGTAGKSTTKNWFNTLLSNDYTTIATRGNHNTRTGVPLTIYLPFAQKIANGILTMINHNTMESIHVLNYPDLSVKEKFRIIYYDGEAALALLRLYQIDNNPKWLETVELMFDRFIKKILEI